LPEATDTPFLRLRDVGKHFGEHAAVRAVDLDIARGEFVTLLGPSGCGKTTLLRMIAGFEQPTTGTIELEESDLTRLPPERRPLNMVFQSYALFPHMNVYDNVAYGLRSARIASNDIRTRVKDALELVGLERFADRRVQELSGGMSQRVALARAIVNEPSVLLLDEPLGALDLQLRKRMQVELRAIQDRVGTTFIYVTHDQEEALVMSHRVVCMHEGAVIQIGTPTDVYNRPRTRFVAEFVGDATLVPAVVETVVGGDELTVGVQGAGVIHTRHHGEGALTVGEPGLLALRPEHLVLTESGNGVFAGTVRDQIFLGSSTHYLVDTDGGVRVRVAGTDDAAARGDQVGIAIAPGRGAFVRQERSFDAAEALPDERALAEAEA
jgi:ABC-type Fe3+/spermidine/putrescine transport system ATPase subunit